MDRATPFEGGDLGSTPGGGTFKINPPIAQLVEQIPLKDTVQGSSPCGRTTKDKTDIKLVLSFVDHKDSNKIGVGKEKFFPVVEVLKPQGFKEKKI